MVLPINQPVPEILRGWTVARIIPAGKDAGGRIIRDPIPPGKSVAELGQDIFRHRAGHPARCGPDSGGVWGPAGRLEEAVTPPRLLRYPLAERTATGGMLPMEIHRHMPERDRENDMGVDSQNRPFRFTTDLPVMSCFSESYASVPDLPVAERAKRR